MTAEAPVATGGRSRAGWRSALLARGAPPGAPFAHVGAALQRVAEAGPDHRLLVLRALGPTVAFSSRDTHAAGYPDACVAAAAHGFVPVMRPVGGTFAPLHRGSLVVEHYGAVSGDWLDMHARFAWHTEALLEAFAGLGLDARLGALAGEYCPGEYSINAAGRVKVSGTAQRVSRGAWLVSTVVQVSDPAPLAPVTTACAAAMGCDVDPAVTGSIAGETGISDVACVGRAIARTFREHGLIGRGATVGLSRLAAESHMSSGLL